MTAGLHQFETGLDGDGRFTLSRAYVEPRLNVGLSRDLVFSLGLGVAFDDYRFSRGVGLAGLEPWSTVTTVSLNGFVRWRFEPDWTLFAIPTLRAAAERGGDLDRGISGGGLAGVSYRFGDSLTLGPGFGYLTEIEDDPSVFPIVLVDWEIADGLRLRTGGGTGASRGPGMTVDWDVLPSWQVTVGGRYEELRFRLDDAGAAPGGVGENEVVTLYGSVTREFESGAKLSLLAGIGVGGSLQLDDRNGNQLAREDYDAAPFVGVLFELGF